jgi:uncharacterized phage protein gp47/JayE
MQTIPTLQELIDATIAALESELGVSLSTLPEAIANELRAEANAFAGREWLYYKALGKVQKNIWPDTAETEESGGTLQRFGRVKLNRNPFTATQQYIEVDVTGDIGATINANTVFKSDDDSSNPGLLFILDEAFVLTGTVDTITLRALTAGTAGALIVGDTLTATEPITNVESAAVVTAETVAPEDEEDIEDYRAKTVQAFRTEPQGGATGDYRLWGYDAQGVREIYPYVKSGVNNVMQIYVESDTGDGTADSDLLDDVEAVIELDPDTTKDISERGRRPAQVTLEMLSVVVKEIAIEFTDATILGEALTAEQETTLEDALREAIALIRPFIAGADVLSEKNDTLSENKIINIALTALPGLFWTGLEMTVDASPQSSITFDNGQIPHLDSVTHV